MSHEGPNNSNKMKDSDWKMAVEAVPDNLYSRLGINPNSSAQEIREKFTEAAREYHPEAQGGGDEAKFKRISEAYNALKTPEAKQKYNAELFGQVIAASMRPKPGESTSAQAGETQDQNTESKGSSQRYEHVDMNSEDWKRRRSEYEERVRAARQREQDEGQRDAESVKPQIDEVRKRLREDSVGSSDESSQTQLRDSIARRESEFRLELGRQAHPPAHDENARKLWRDENVRIHTSLQDDVAQMRASAYGRNKDQKVSHAESQPGQSKAWPEQDAHDGIVREDLANRDRIIREDQAKRPQNL
jgi:curved DNA-binding protein CbpA